MTAWQSAGAQQPVPSAAETPLVAITGANGFIGRHLVPELALRGWRVRLLLRRDPIVPEWQHLRPEVVAGGLDDPAALVNLVEGATAIVHVAGLIKAAKRRQYFAVNRDGAAALASAARMIAPAAHFVHVSSLAAREPALSDYAASKRAGEIAVRDTFGSPMTILRPSVVYGPGDRETLRFFQLARLRCVPVPGPADGRVAMIHVRDLARLVAMLVTTPPADGCWRPRTRVRKAIVLPKCFAPLRARSVTIPRDWCAHRVRCCASWLRWAMLHDFSDRPRC